MRICVKNIVAKFNVFFGSNIFLSKKNKHLKVALILFSWKV